MYRMRWSYADLYTCPADVLHALTDILDEGSNSDDNGW